MKKLELTYDFPYANCATFTYTNMPPSQLHTHSYDEIAIVLNGTGLHGINNNTYPIMRGDVFVIHGNQVHKIIKPQNLIIANILYERHFFELLKDVFKELPGFNALFIYEPKYRQNSLFKAKLHLQLEQIEKVMQLFNLIATEQAEHNPGSKQVMESVFIQLLVMLCRNYNQSENKNTKKMLKISSVIDYMENHFAEKITIDTLCSLLDMPSATFRRAFKLTTGNSPIDYLIKLRINKAAGMMRENSSLHVIDVCLRTGFENTGHFAGKFKKNTGFTPIQYLKKQREMIGT